MGLAILISRSPALPARLQSHPNRAKVHVADQCRGPPELRRSRRHGLVLRERSIGVVGLLHGPLIFDIFSVFSVTVPLIAPASRATSPRIERTLRSPATCSPWCHTWPSTGCRYSVFCRPVLSPRDHPCEAITKSFSIVPSHPTNAVGWRENRRTAASSFAPLPLTFSPANNPHILPLLPSPPLPSPPLSSPLLSTLISSSKIDQFFIMYVNVYIQTIFMGCRHSLV